MGWSRAVAACPRPGAGLRIRDYGPSRAIDQAAADLRSRREARNTFADEHFAELAAEAKRQEAQSIRDAIASDDPDAIRQAINPTPDKNVLTSADLPG